MAAKKTVKQAPAGSNVPLQADPLPKQGAPSPPVGFAAPAKYQRRPGALPTTQQVRDAGDVAGELKSSSKYNADFGNRVPPAATIAAALTLAQGWSNQLQAAETWLPYVRAQYESAWRAALGLTKELQPEFQLAVKHDASVATRYPQTGIRCTTPVFLTREPARMLG
jgi:hypothetical protein